MNETQYFPYEHGYLQTEQFPQWVIKYQTLDYTALTINHSNGRATSESGKLPAVHVKNRKRGVAGACRPSYLCLTLLPVITDKLTKCDNNLYLLINKFKATM